jgi:hypothetical protein
VLSLDERTRITARDIAGGWVVIAVLLAVLVVLS